MTDHIVGEIYKTNTFIPDEYQSIDPGTLVRLERVGPLCQVKSLDGKWEFGIPPGNLVPVTDEELADGGPPIREPRSFLPPTYEDD